MVALYQRRDASPSGSPGPGVRPVDRLRRYLRFWGPNVDKDVDDELRFHLEMRIRDYEARGLTHAEAKRVARERLGDIEQIRLALRTHDAARERRRTRHELMDRLARDVRVALRGFRHSPTFTVTAVLILGLGIGMAVATWTVFNAVLLRRVPVQDAARIVVPRLLDQTGTVLALDEHDVAQLRHESRTMRLIAGYMHGGAYPFPLMDGDQPLTLAGTQVEGQFFDVLGVRPLMGRLVGPNDDSLSRVIVLSYDAWQRHFGGDPGIVGHHLRQPLLNATYTVVGVAPPGIDFPAGTEYWEAIPYPDQALDLVARLAPNATPAMAREESLDIIKRFDRNESAAPIIGGADARLFTEAVVGNVRPVLVMLLAAVGLLLLIVCINVGNLLLHRATGRVRELALRRALGVTHGDIVRQLFVESALLAVAGGGLGLVTGEIARRALIAAAPAQLPRVDEIRVAGAPVAAAAAMALFATLVFGVVPALVAVRRNPASPLRLDTRSGTSTRQRRSLRHALVGSQVALALILLAGAALLTRSVQRLQSIDLGFRSDHLSVLALSIPERLRRAPVRDMGQNRAADCGDAWRDGVGADDHRSHDRTELLQWRVANRRRVPTRHCAPSLDRVRCGGSRLLPRARCPALAWTGIPGRRPRARRASRHCQRDGRAPILAGPGPDRPAYPQVG